MKSAADGRVLPPPSVRSAGMTGPCALSVVGSRGVGVACVPVGLGDSSSGPSMSSSSTRPAGAVGALLVLGSSCGPYLWSNSVLSTGAVLRRVVSGRLLGRRSSRRSWAVAFSDGLGLGSEWVRKYSLMRAPILCGWSLGAPGVGLALVPRADRSCVVGSGGSGLVAGDSPSEEPPGHQMGRVGEFPVPWVIQARDVPYVC